jgi:hypothetical protein
MNVGQREGTSGGEDFHMPNLTWENIINAVLCFLLSVSLILKASQSRIFIFMIHQSILQATVPYVAQGSLFSAMLGKASFPSIPNHHQAATAYRQIRLHQIMPVYHCRRTRSLPRVKEKALRTPYPLRCTDHLCQ